MTRVLYGPPHPPLPEQYVRAYSGVGIIAERGKWIAICPLPPAEDLSPRIYLDEKAARKLLEWLPKALAFALHQEDESADA